MKHNYTVEGLTYRLRPISLEDAELILKIRLEDEEYTKYINEVPNDVELEKEWLKKYFQREGDYFFAIESRFTGEVEGLIALYDEIDGKAEWGRWTVIKGSMSSVESVYLIYKFAFNQLKLEEVYCRTVKDNESVVSFHSSTGLKVRETIKDCFKIKGILYDAVEQYITREQFENEIEENLYNKCYMLFMRNMKIEIGGMEFHHIGVACKDIEKDKKMFSMLGYRFEKEKFCDLEQGIVGIFGQAKNQPCIELLENAENSETLTPVLAKGQKLYHYAYTVGNIEKAAAYLEKGRAILISPLKESVYFKKRICFYMLPNMFLIELIEK